MHGRVAQVLVREWMKCDQQHTTTNVSWMIRDTTEQYDSSDEAWEKKTEKNVKSQMPNLGQQALLCERCRATEGSNQFTGI